MEITQGKILKALNDTNNCLYIGGMFTGKITDVCDNLIFCEDIDNIPFYLTVSFLKNQNVTFMNGKNGQYIEEM